MRAERTRPWLKDERHKLAQGMCPAIHPHAVFMQSPWICLGLNGETRIVKSCGEE